MWLIIPPLVDEETTKENDSSDLIDPEEDEILFFGNFVEMDSVHKGSGLVNIVMHTQLLQSLLLLVDLSEFRLISSYQTNLN